MTEPGAPDELMRGIVLNLRRVSGFQGLTRIQTGLHSIGADHIISVYLRTNSGLTRAMAAAGDRQYPLACFQNVRQVLAAVRAFLDARRLTLSPNELVAVGELDLESGIRLGLKFNREQQILTVPQAEAAGSEMDFQTPGQRWAQMLGGFPPPDATDMPGVPLLLIYHVPESDHATLGTNVLELAVKLGFGWNFNARFKPGDRNRMVQSLRAGLATAETIIQYT